MKRALLGLAVFGGTLLIARKTRAMSVQRQKPEPTHQEAKLLRLLPPFGDKIRTLLRNLNANGFDVVLGSTSRTREEALAYAASGVGVADSMHIYDAAVDLNSRTYGARMPLAFRDAIGAEAERLGLTWGGRWTTGKYGKYGDWRHVQAIPVKDQNKFRAMTRDEQVAYLERLYA